MDIRKHNEGNGQQVPRGAEVTVHYTGRLTDGTVSTLSLVLSEIFDFMYCRSLTQVWDEESHSLSEWESGKSSSVGMKASLEWKWVRKPHLHVHLTMRMVAEVLGVSSHPMPPSSSMSKFLAISSEETDWLMSQILIWAIEKLIKIKSN